MYKINVNYILCIYFLLNPNLIDAHSENNNIASTSNKLKQGRAKLINGKEYILSIAQEFVYELEEYGFCNFKLSNFSHKIDQSAYFGRIVKGIIHYKNGFIGTVDEISLLENPSDGNLNDIENTAEFLQKMHMLNLMAFFDFTAELTETKISGTVAIPIANIDFTLRIKKFFFNNYLEYNVTIQAASTNNIPVVWYYEPSNSYTQIINKYADKIDIDSDLKLIASEYWEKLLGKVIDKIPFPELCLFCTQERN